MPKITVPKPLMVLIPTSNQKDPISNQYISNKPDVIKTPNLYYLTGNSSVKVRTIV